MRHSLSLLFHFRAMPKKRAGSASKKPVDVKPRPPPFFGVLMPADPTDYYPLFIRHPDFPFTSLHIRVPKDTTLVRLKMEIAAQAHHGAIRVDQINLFKHRLGDATRMDGVHVTLRTIFRDDPDADAAMVIPSDPLTDEIKSMPSRRLTTVQKVTPSTAYTVPKAGEITLFYEIADAQREMVNPLLKNEGLKQWRPAVLSLKQAMLMPAAPISFS
jgi:hypothetical protein